MPGAPLSRSVAGRVVVVTGAASGMGRAIAQLFAAEGAHVAACDRNGEGVAAVAGEITAAGGVAQAFPARRHRPAAIEHVVAEVVARLGPVGILVNNAGVSLPAPIDGDDYEAAWDLTLAVNLTGYARMIRACLPHLLAAGAGRIVNIASTEGLGATPYISPYTASKHGVVGLTRSLATELGRARHHRQLHLPRPDQHRHDRADPRRRQAEVRAPPRSAAPLRRARGGRADGAEPRASRVVVRERRGDPRRRRPVDQVRLIRSEGSELDDLLDMYAGALDRLRRRRRDAMAARPGRGAAARAGADLRAHRVQPGGVERSG